MPTVRVTSNHPTLSPPQGVAHLSHCPSTSPTLRRRLPSNQPIDRVKGTPVTRACCLGPPSAPSNFRGISCLLCLPLNQISTPYVTSSLMTSSSSTSPSQPRRTSSSTTTSSTHAQGIDPPLVTVTDIIFQSFSGITLSPTCCPLLAEQRWFAFECGAAQQQ